MQNVKLAANVDKGAWTPDALLAGDSPLVTRDGETLKSGVNYAAFTVLGRVTATGKLTTYNPGASDGTEVAECILVDAVDATSADKTAAVYIGGYFNHAALSWHASADTYLKRVVAFRLSPIMIGKIPAY